MIGTASKESLSNSHFRTQAENTLENQNMAIQNHDFTNDSERSMPIKIGDQ